jgi:hypothetical protein
LEGEAQQEACSVVQEVLLVGPVDLEAERPALGVPGALDLAADRSLELVGGGGGCAGPCEE